MKLSTLQPHNNVDDELIRVIRLIHTKVVGGADDCIMLTVGPTGVGKTTITLWMYELYTENRYITQVALSKEQFVAGLRIGDSLPVKDRVLMYDELELNRRNSTTKWNVDMMTLYYKIRGKRFLHLWNHPSLEMVDREFVRERINAVLFVYDKSKTRPRRYYFFTKEKIMEFYDKYGNLSLPLLKAHATEYANFRGAFRKYDGVLAKEYQERKDKAMSNAIDDFTQKYGSTKTYSILSIAKQYHLSQNTISKALKVAIANNIIPPDRISSAGRAYIQDEDVKKLLEIIKKGEAKVL